MKREIKFRAWLKPVDHFDGEMIFEGCDSDSIMISNGNGFSVLEEYEYLDKDRFEIMQYTGLKDKNGVEIYEGDIVQYEDGKILKVLFKLGYFFAYDGYTNTSEASERMLFDDRTPFEPSFEIKVIGNIHENPELLK